MTRSSQAETRPPVTAAPAPGSAPSRGETARVSSELPLARRFPVLRLPQPGWPVSSRRIIAGIRGLGAGLNRLLARTLPDQPAEGVQLSPSTMLFIALAVPVVVVAVAATIYMQRGRGEMQVAALQTARQFATQAAARDDPELRLKDWNQALTWLDKADSYGGSEEATQLRNQVQDGVDGLGRRGPPGLPPGDDCSTG